MKKTFTFIPSACKEQEVKQINAQTGVEETIKVPPTFEGKIVLSVPTNEERMGYLEQTGIEIGEDGKVKQVSSNLAILKKMIAASKTHYHEVDLKNLETGEHHKSFDDMNYDADTQGIMTEVAFIIMQGLKVPKN